MIVVGLDPDREPGDVLDRVFPPAESDDTFADEVDAYVAKHGGVLNIACRFVEVERKR